MITLKLKEYIDKKGITRYELSKRTLINYQVINKYYKNAIVRYDTFILDKICEALDCQISDIIEYKKG